MYTGRLVPVLSPALRVSQPVAVVDVEAVVAVVVSETTRLRHITGILASQYNGQ